MKSLKDKELEANLAARRARLRRLELEVAKERAAIALLEQTPTHTLPNLLDTLPQELRDHIWGYCVAPGKVFLSKSRVAYDGRFHDFDEYEKPHWLLLAVSRSIRQEAAKVLFEQNQFIWSHLTSGFRTLVCEGFDSHSFDGSDVQLRAFAHKHLRSVSMTFDLRSPIRRDPLMNAAYMRENTSSSTTAWSSLDFDTRRVEAHDQLFDDAYEGVQDLMDAVTDCEALTRLELDFTNCYCPIGCCRTVHKVMAMFSEGGLQTPPHLRVLGTKNREERATIANALGCYRSDHSKMTAVLEKFAVGREMQDPFMGRSPFWYHLTGEDLDVELGRVELSFETTSNPNKDEE